MNRAPALRNLGLSRFLKSGTQFRRTIGRKQNHCCARQFSTSDQVLNDVAGDDKAAESTPLSWDYDILINGGGIVGITFAAQVLQKTSNKLKIGQSNFGSDCTPLKSINALDLIVSFAGIIDVRPPPTLASCYEKDHPDIRVYALSPTSIKVLKDIDAWKHIEARTQPYHNMQIWVSNFTPTCATTTL